MINKLKLIGIVLVLSGMLDVAIAAYFLPEEVRIYLYAAGAASALIGIVVFLKGLTRPE